MKKVLTLTLSLLLLYSVEALAQNSGSSSSGRSSSGANSTRKRGPVFRATKDQINQAQSILKERGFYNGDQTGKLDDATRDGLRKYQQAEGLKNTGTLNKVTLEKMGVALTEKQKAM
jgi:peptidoglycan hydrolase-like protein with peptidoglycan-binding domain